MNFLEKDLEQIIFEADRIDLIRRGLNVENSKLHRQLKIGNYGVADLVSFYRTSNKYENTINITIYELKNNVLNINAFNQSIRYANGIRHYITSMAEDRDLCNVRDCNINFKIVLIGREIDKDHESFCYFPSIVSSSEFELHLVTYRCDIDGIKFIYNKDYLLTKPGFKK